MHSKIVLLVAIGLWGLATILPLRAEEGGTGYEQITDDSGAGPLLGLSEAAAPVSAPS